MLGSSHIFLPVSQVFPSMVSSFFFRVVFLDPNNYITYSGYTVLQYREFQSLKDFCSIFLFNIPSHSIPSHPIPSHPIPSHPIPSHPIPSHPIPSHPIPSCFVFDQQRLLEWHNILQVHFLELLLCSFVTYVPCMLYYISSPYCPFVLLLFSPLFTLLIQTIKH